MSVSVSQPRIAPVGDAAVTVEFGDRVDRGLSRAVLALDQALTAEPIDGVIETAPSFRALLVRFDPLVADADGIAAAIEERLARSGAGGEETAATGRLWRVPACYDAPFALDLEEVAVETGLSTEAVIAAHLAEEQYVYMIGFLPGCPYIGDAPPALSLPRRADPRLKVPAGSVASAVGLTVIYPVESPGGWRVLGRTPIQLFDPGATPPALFAPGDRIVFERIDMAEYERMRNDGFAPTPEAAS